MNRSLVWLDLQRCSREVFSTEFRDRHSHAAETPHQSTDKPRALSFVCKLSVEPAVETPVVTKSLQVTLATQLYRWTYRPDQRLLVGLKDTIGWAEVHATVGVMMTWSLFSYPSNVTAVDTDLALQGRFAGRDLVNNDLSTDSCKVAINNPGLSPFWSVQF